MKKMIFGTKTKRRRKDDGIKIKIIIMAMIILIRLEEAHHHHHHHRHQIKTLRNTKRKITRTTTSTILQMTKIFLRRHNERLPRKLPQRKSITAIKLATE